MMLHPLHTTFLFLNLSRWDYLLMANIFFYAAAPQEVEKKKEKDVQVIDLTIDSDTDSDGGDDDEEEVYDDGRDLNTPRYVTDHPSKLVT